MAVGGSGGRGSEVRAGGAFVELFVKDGKLTAGLESARKRVMGFARQAGAIGAGMAGAGTALLAPLMAITKSFLDTANNAGDAADRLGTTTEELTRLGYAAKLSGSNMGDVEKASLSMAKAIDADSDAFRRLGLSAEQLRGMSLQEQFLAMGAALEGVEDRTQRVAMAMATMGESGVKLLPMLAGLQGKLSESDRVGATVSSQEAKDAAEVNAALTRSWTAIQAAVSRVGAAFLSIKTEVGDIADVVVNISTGIAQWINNNQKLVLGIAATGAAVVGVGTALLTVAGAAAVLGAGLAAIPVIIGTITAIVGALLTPFGLIAAAVVAVGVGLASWIAFTESGSNALRGFLGLFEGIIGSIKTAFGGIMDAMMGGDFKLAGEIAMAGLNAAWKQGLVLLQQAWNSFKAEIVDGWFAIQEAAEIAMAMVKGTFTGNTDAMIKEIQKMNAAAQKERDRSRSNALQDAIEDARKADAELQRLADQAAANRQRKQAPAPVRQAIAAAGVQSLVSAVSSGAFQASNFGQVLSRPSGEGIAKQQLAVAKQQAGDIRELKDHVVNGEGGVWD